jgi:chemotaxis methyl-accepting protein methylase
LTLKRYRTGPQLSVEEFIPWRDLIQERTGLYLREHQLDFLARRLWRRMRELSLHRYGDYYSLASTRPAGHDEWKALMELIVNCESGFFRDVGAFEALMERVLPELIQEIHSRGDTRLSMWSAGCSRGQEAYSLAMAFAEVHGEREGITHRVIGTDISRNALARARSGQYSFAEVRTMHPSFRQRYMIPVACANNTRVVHGHTQQALARHLVRYAVREDIRKSVHFGLMNLTDPPSYWVPLQDVIFCQNVLMYFSPEDRARTTSLLLEQLRPGGYLFLSSGENVGVRVRGAGTVRFKEILGYKRNKEAVDVQLDQR